MANSDLEVKLCADAAVLVVVEQLTGNILLTQRSAHLNSHSAEVALPGGKCELCDQTILATALRETYEEVGLRPDSLNVISELPMGVTAAGIRVKPFVATTLSGSDACINSEELDAVFWLPEEVLVTDTRIRTDVFELDGKEFWSPAYRYERFEIWGFTSRVLVDYMRLCRDIFIHKNNPAPIALHKPRVIPGSSV